MVFPSVYTNSENEALEWVLGVLIHLMRREVHALCKVCGCAVKTAVTVMGMDLVLDFSLWITLASYILRRQNIFFYTIWVVFSAVLSFVVRSSKSKI